jgi:hypothetical protein
MYCRLGFSNEVYERVSLPSVVRPGLSNLSVSMFLRWRVFVDFGAPRGERTIVEAISREVRATRPGRRATRLETKVLL